MDYKIMKGDEVVNTIVASPLFVEVYCAENGYTYEEIPEVKPEPAAPTPAQQREEVYNTQPLFEWEGELLTVTTAAQKWQYYAAEGSPKADELQVLIAEAKQSIREQYPDEEAAE